MQIDRRLNSRPGPVRPRRRFKLSLSSFRFWLTLSAIGILGSLVILLIQILLFARSLDRIPAGQVVAGVPVGGLTRPEAESRLNKVYGSPLTLDYRVSSFQLDPTTINFKLDTEAMLGQVSAAQSSGSVWADFWAYLWSEPPPPPPPVPLQASFDQNALNKFLTEVAAHYDDNGTPAKADPATLGFTPGSAGYALDMNTAFALINTALRSPTDRAVTLPVNDFSASPPTFDTLADLLYTDVRLHQFSGTVSIYLADLDTGQTLDMAMNDQKPFPVGDGIAYSGMSTIKVPVAMTFFRYKDGPPTPDEQLLLDGIFSDSANEYTDIILGILGDGGGLIGANRVSDTMETLGLRNTYLAGLLNTLGAITTPRDTPANIRTDIDLSPDRYNQTTASDMGRLMVMIYQCSKGGGPLMETFPGQFTAEECQRIIDLLAENKLIPRFIAGGSPGATVVHKHGWDSSPLNNVGDAALVFSPGGNYAMTVYVHRDEPVPFDTADRLVISLATAVFNYYNRR
ncbi:MAG: serine hydrolase [Chloroflexi bacterium]|nr:serine hydrolase [Chloroflexota bacterium]